MPLDCTQKPTNAATAGGEGGHRPTLGTAFSGRRVSVGGALTRNPAVLDLGVAKPADRRLLALVPEVLLGQLEWVPVAHRDLLRVRQRLEVIDGLHDGRRRAERLTSGQNQLDMLARFDATSSILRCVRW